MVLTNSQTTLTQKSTAKPSGAGRESKAANKWDRTASVGSLTALQPLLSASNKIVASLSLSLWRPWFPQM